MVCGIDRGELRGGGRGGEVNDPIVRDFMTWPFYHVFFVGSPQLTQKQIPAVSHVRRQLERRSGRSHSPLSGRTCVQARASLLWSASLPYSEGLRRRIAAASTHQDHATNRAHCSLRYVLLRLVKQVLPKYGTGSRHMLLVPSSRRCTYVVHG